MIAGITLAVLALLLLHPSNLMYSVLTFQPGSESSVAVQTYLCVTVSNPRAGPPLHKPEDCFIPFKKKGNAAGE